MKRDICFTCDNNYVYYTYVAAYSLLANRKPENAYRVHILTDEGMTAQHEELFCSLSKMCGEHGGGSCPSYTGGLQRCGSA